MTWKTSRPNGGKTADKYRSKQHRDDVQQHRAALAAAGSGICAETICLMSSRLITPDMRLHLCHDRRTGAVLGLGHARCNTSEAARYARSRQDHQTTGTGYRRPGW